MWAKIFGTDDDQLLVTVNADDDCTYLEFEKVIEGNKISGKIYFKCEVQELEEKLSLLTEQEAQEGFKEILKAIDPLDILGAQ